VHTVPSPAELEPRRDVIPPRTQRSEIGPIVRQLVAPFVVVAVTLLAFAPALGAGFVTWDDDINFINNQAYRGLGAQQLHWMWTTFHMGHYTPLTWMTLGLDYMLWGMDARGYHATNVLLHVANAVLVYVIARRLLALARLPERFIRDPQVIMFASAFAALVFATHPLRVESVAWVTERRDVLSCFFYLLAIAAYVRSLDDDRVRSRWYWASVAACGCAVLSKATAMTLPIALLLLNVYPLRRLDRGSASAVRVARELAPFLALAIAAAAVSVIALNAHWQLGVSEKISVSAYGFAFYLRKTIAPMHLSPLYPMPEHIDPSAPRYLVAYLVVAAYLAVAWATRRRWPGGSTSMIAFFAILLPMLGAVQNGNVIAADRYTYHPAIALSILAGGMFMALDRVPFAFKAAAATAIVATLTTLTWRQSLVWHDSRRFWTYTAAMADSSSTAHAALGRALYADGAFAASVAHFERASHIDTLYPDGYNNAGIALAQLGRWPEAIADYENALAIKPGFGAAESNLGVALAAEGRPDAAIEHYAKAVAADSTNADAETNWGNALVRLNRLDDATSHYEAALRIQPRNAGAHLNLGVARAKQGRMREAIDEFRRALEIDSGLVEAKQFLDRALSIDKHASQPPP
jgi:Flp pilus assembly protein TadD